MMKVKFSLTTLSALKGHVGNSTRERALTAKEEEVLRHSWELYKTFLAEDQETIEMIDNIYGPGQWSSLNSPEKRVCWRVGHETRKCGSFYCTTTSSLSGRLPRLAA